LEERNTKNLIIKFIAPMILSSKRRNGNRWIKLVEAEENE
jgi:hypothetical protein